MSGVKGKSGRKRKTLTREAALQSLTQKLPKAIDVMEDTVEGINQDRLRYEAAKEIKDSVMGKPKQQTEITGGREIGTGMIKEILAIAYEERRKLGTPLLLEGGDDVQEQGVTEGDDKGQGKALQG